MTLTNTGHTVQVTPPAGSYIVVGGTRYDLIQFHFHHPGEEAVKGRLPDMDIHLVHKSADGKYAVVAVRLNEGDPNALLAALWEHLPKTVGATDQLTEFMSPLSAPPCTEGVQWFVLENDVQLSRDQLRSFGALYKVNSRTLQPTHGRKIEANQ
jgi:carbonic anhydrase